MSSTNSNAEIFAKQAEKLPNFAGFSLIGVKNEVAKLLSMIGRVEGIFSTYTAHDISHIDQMLKSLDWMIPPETKGKMTAIDWLMIVLGIYFHDLGMVVTAEEFKNRRQNSKFNEFYDLFENEESGSDYRERVKELDEGQLERFVYQEFIRTEHAIRIREWITGKVSYDWGEDISPITDAIKNGLKNLPSRFLTNLGVICESHHLEDIEDIEKYPLCQRFGNDSEEVANIQFSAIILRTADLLHVTKDRTPSVSFQILALSDPLGIEEWNKQQGVMCVGMLKRNYDPIDTENHVIQIEADFDEERPFFSLTEYITYANDQIQRSKKWADTSQFHDDATGYFFPWHTVQGHILVEGNIPRPLKFQLDRGRLLDLLVGHTIYNDPTVAVRELIQNAIDAVRFQHHLNLQNNPAVQLSKMGSVKVVWDSSTRYLDVIDDGVGMSYNTIIDHLMKVGSSFYNTPNFKAQNSEFSPISRFGIGVLTYFMISDDIEIITSQQEVGHRIRMSSVHADYLLKKLSHGDSELKGVEPHGTKIRLRIRPSVKIKDDDLGKILDHWVILPECDILFKENGNEFRKVGFDSVQDVLKKWSPDKPEKAERKYIVKNKQVGLAKYEFGTTCQKSFSPEQRFVRYQETRNYSSFPIGVPPAVCVEGIRVANTLPGYRNSGDNICTLLSVRGNKNLKTTVSRSDLEVDEEYSKMINICHNFLVEHIQGEVTRISCLDGAPLSQASTAATWMYESISRNLAQLTSSEALNSMYGNVPRFVLETGTETGEFSRDLISKSVLFELGSFWTYQSRFANYLGVMSRDLGKEIGINEFLSSMAPSMVDQKVTPILIDHEQHFDDLFGYFCIDQVQFNRKEKKIVAHWTLNSKEITDINIFSYGKREVLLNLTKKYDVEQTDYIQRWFRGSGREVLAKRNQIFVADFDGDVEETLWVQHGEAIAIADSSIEAKIWEKLVSLSAHFDEKHTDPKNTQLIEFSMFIFIFLMSATIPNRPNHINISGSEIKHFKTAWDRVVKDLRNIDTEKSNLLNEDHDLFSDKDKWFNARSYWFSWGASYF
ncbi:MAG: ATP-binding protein [Rhodospirillales bacterium]|nr:ATP-binding protein [Rhodospirillales bacterium]